VDPYDLALKTKPDLTLYYYRDLADPMCSTWNYVFLSSLAAGFSRRVSIVGAPNENPPNFPRKDTDT